MISNFQQHITTGQGIFLITNNFFMMYHFDFQVSRVWKIVSFTSKMEKKKNHPNSQNQQEDTNHQAWHYKMQTEITKIHESPPIKVAR